MIIMYPNGIIRLSLLQYCFTKFLVHLHISIPKAVLVGDVLREIMKSRPQDAIAEAFVKILDFLLIQKNRYHLLFFQIAPRPGFLIATPEFNPGPSFPIVVLSGKDTAQSSSQAARTCLVDHFPVLLLRT